MMISVISISIFYIPQWNVQNLIAYGQELQRCVSIFKEKPDSFGTILKPCLDFKIPGYERLRLETHDRSGGGCATFIKSEIQYRRTDKRSNLECLAVEVWINHSSLTVINFYNLCKCLVLSEFEEFMEYVKCPIVWVNTDNPLWGSDSMNCNLVVVEEFLEK